MAINIYRESGFIVPKKSRAEVRAIAHEVIDFANDKYAINSDKFDVVRLISNWSVYSRRCDAYPNFEVLSTDEMIAGPAAYDSDSNTIFFSVEVWVEAENEVPEAREIFAHEFGHLCLGHPPPKHHRSFEFHTVVPETDSEHQAEWFARELLADVRKINQSDTPTDIASRFNITEETAIRIQVDLFREKYFSKS